MRLCSYFGKLPSEIDDEPADNLNKAFAVMIGEGMKADRTGTMPPQSKKETDKWLK